MNDPALGILRIRIKAAIQQAQAFQVSSRDIRRILIETDEELYLANEGQRRVDSHSEAKKAAPTKHE